MRICNRTHIDVATHLILCKIVTVLKKKLTLNYPLISGAPTVQVAPPVDGADDPASQGFFGNVMSSIRRSPSPSKLNVNSVQHAKVSPTNSLGYGGEPQNSFRKMPDE